MSQWRGGGGRKRRRRRRGRRRRQRWTWSSLMNSRSWQVDSLEWINRFGWLWCTRSEEKKWRGRRWRGYSCRWRGRRWHRGGRRRRRNRGRKRAGRKLFHLAISYIEAIESALDQRTTTVWWWRWRVYSITWRIRWRWRVSWDRSGWYNPVHTNGSRGQTLRSNTARDFSWSWVARWTGRRPGRRRTERVDETQGWKKVRVNEMNLWME